MALSSRGDNVSSSVGLPPCTTSIDDINVHPSNTPTNVLFPNGKFFGIFPRMGNNVEDQIQVCFYTIFVNYRSLNNSDFSY